MTKPDRPPWGKLARWNILFHLNYLVRVISFDIWWSSRDCGVPFEELKFGETPLSAIREILKHVRVDENSTIYDLGCGRGRAAFLFHFMTGAKVIGIDLIGSFLLTGRRVARWMGLESRILFCYQDIREADLRDADLIFVCASCMGSETRQALAEKIALCPAGTQLVSVGWKPDHGQIELLEEFKQSYSWGKAGTYVSQVREATIRP